MLTTGRSSATAICIGPEFVGDADRRAANECCEFGQRGFAGNIDRAGSKACHLLADFALATAPISATANPLRNKCRATSANFSLPHVLVSQIVPGARATSFASATCAVEQRADAAGSFGGMGKEKSAGPASRPSKSAHARDSGRRHGSSSVGTGMWCV